MLKRNKTIKRIIERDGTRCWICGEEIASNLLMVRYSQLGNNSLAANKDHVIPVSKGGKNHLDNLKLSHAACNSRRADRDITPELVEWCRKTVARIKSEKKRSK